MHRPQPTTDQPERALTFTHSSKHSLPSDDDDDMDGGYNPGAGEGPMSSGNHFQTSYGGAGMSYGAGGGYAEGDDDAYD